MCRFLCFAEVSTFTHNAQWLPVLCYLQLLEQLNSSGGEGSSGLVHVCLSRVNWTDIVVVSLSDYIRLLGTPQGARYHLVFMHILPKFSKEILMCALSGVLHEVWSQKKAWNFKSILLLCSTTLHEVNIFCCCFWIWYDRFNVSLIF